MYYAYTSHACGSGVKETSADDKIDSGAQREAENFFFVIFKRLCHDLTKV